MDEVDETDNIDFEETIEIDLDTTENSSSQRTLYPTNYEKSKDYKRYKKTSATIDQENDAGESLSKCLSVVTEYYAKNQDNENNKLDPEIQFCKMITSHLLGLTDDEKRKRIKRKFLEVLMDENVL